MPCDGQPIGLTEEQKAERARAKAEALKQAERDLLAGKIKVIEQADGTKTFDGWPAAEREGWCDACAYRALMAEGSSALRMAQARQQPDRMQRRAAQQ